MRSGAKVAVIGGVFTVVAGGVGYGAYNLWNGITGGTTPTTTSAAAPRKAGSGPVTAEEVERTAKDFLAAWAKGDEAAAGELPTTPAPPRPPSPASGTRPMSRRRSSPRANRWARRCRSRSTRP